MATPSSFAATSDMQGWTKTSFDQRTFSDLIGETTDELNRPDLQQPAIRAIQNAIRTWRRKPFFFGERDNRLSVFSVWQANLFWSMGSTIMRVVGGTPFAFVACTQGFAGTVEPTWPATIMTPPSWGTFIDNTIPGSVQDNQVLWANAGLWSGNTASGVQVGAGYDQYGLSTYWTQLSMIPNLNQYNTPLDFIAPRTLAVTVSGIKYDVPYFPYETYRALDIINPPVRTNFPANWTYAGQKIYLWPWPNQFAPIFLLYTGSDMPPTRPTDVNTWTTIGAQLIKCAAKGLLNRDVIRDTESAQADFTAANDEYQSLLLQQVMQSQTSGIPPEEW